MAGLCAPLPTLRRRPTDCNARLGADVNRYSLIVSDLHRLLVAGLPAHCETFWALPADDGLDGGPPFEFALDPRRDRRFWPLV